MKKLEDRMTDKVYKRVLFLGYDSSETILLDELKRNGCEVFHTSQEIDTTQFFDFAVSFGYRYILPKEIIDELGCPIFNLHISYLPYNRGSHPNFWSFFDDTPSGVSIHLIDEGIDTGPIVVQRRVNFLLEEATFAQTYKRLIYEVEILFLKNMKSIITDNWTSTPQLGEGTVHLTKQLPKQFAGWNSNIRDEIKRLKKIYCRQFHDGEDTK